MYANFRMNHGEARSTEKLISFVFSRLRGLHGFSFGSFRILSSLIFFLPSSFQDPCPHFRSSAISNPKTFDIAQFPRLRFYFLSSLPLHPAYPCSWSSVGGLVCPLRLSRQIPPARALTAVPFMLPTVVVAASFNSLLGHRGWIHTSSSYYLANFQLSDPLPPSSSRTSSTTQPSSFASWAMPSPASTPNWSRPPVPSAQTRSAFGET